MRILFAFLVMIGVSCLAAGAGNAGIDVRPDLETTPFSSVTHTTPSVDLSPWDLSFTLDDDAVQNATNVTLMVQMCINSGVCYPPEVTPLTTEDNRTFSARITTLDDHSYVHWRVNIEEGTPPRTIRRDHGTALGPSATTTSMQEPSMVPIAPDPAMRGSFLGEHGARHRHDDVGGCGPSAKALNSTMRSKNRSTAGVHPSIRA